MTRSPLQTEWPRAEFATLYFLAFFASLFATLEGELAHWFTLVLVPFLGTFWLARRAQASASAPEVARRLGLHWPEEGRGILLALALAVGLQGIQLMNGVQRRELVEVLSSESASWLVPGAFLLLLVTAGFTEEFFFRGVLQRSLMLRLRSSPLAIALTSVAFSLYHLPYAYLDPDWASAGDLGQATVQAFVNGTMGGVVLGVVFVRSRGSLMPGVLLHTSINWIPAILFLAQL